MVEDFLSFWCLCVHVLYLIWNLVMLETYYVRISASHFYFYLALVLSHMLYGVDLYMIYMCIYVLFFMYILFCNRAPWMNSLTEWSNGPPYINIFEIKLKNIVDLWNLTHWGPVTHLGVSELTIIGSDNGLSSGRRQPIIWTNAGILLIRSLGTNFNEILIEIHIFSFKKIHVKMSSAKWRPFCLGLSVLNQCTQQCLGIGCQLGV